MKKTLLICLTLGMVLILGGCADHTPTIVQCAEDCHTYGFWGGLWHGMIAIPDFIGMMIWDDVAVYAQNNNGGWYAFGWLWGAGLIFGSSVTVKNKVSK